MSECKMLLAVVKEFERKANKIRETQTDASIQEVMLSQALYGIQLSIGHILGQIYADLSIEIEEVDGDS